MPDPSAAKNNPVTAVLVNFAGAVTQFTCSRFDTCAPLVACTAFPGPNTYNANTTINPGIYTTGIAVTGGTVTMNAGTYILRGGGLTVSGGSLAVAANAGVLIYNANSTFPVAR